MLSGAKPAFGDLSSSTVGEGAAAVKQAPRLKLCVSIVNEALRLSPGIEHLRLVTTRTVYTDTGEALPSGTRLVVSPSLLHRHPRHWPQPCDTPRPELFSPDAMASRAPGCFLPFSAGAKGCPAGGFALHEMRMMLVLVLQKFELSPAAKGVGVCVTARRYKYKRRASAY